MSESESQIIQAGLDLAMVLRMVSNFRSACLHLPSAEMTGTQHHAQVRQSWGSKPGP